MFKFTAQQVTQSHRIQIPGTVDRVFPLFEPLGEKLWAPDWNPDILYPASGTAQEGAVFTTQHTGEAVKIWTISTYDREQAHVTYINVLPHAYTSRIDVHCQENGENTTSVCVSYTLTALTSHGNEYIEKFTEKQHYQTYISSWQTAIEVYLQKENTHLHTED